MVWWFSLPSSEFKSELGNKESAPVLVFADSIELLHPWLQRI